MDDYNTIEEKDRNEEIGESKLGGFYSGFYLHGQNKGGYNMGL